MAADLIGRFCAEHHTLNGISPGRAREQRNLLLQFAQQLDKPLLETDAGDVRGFMAHLLDNGFKPSTVAKKLNLVRPFFKWAWREQLIDSDRMMRMDDIDPPRGHRNSRPRPYSRADLQRFWIELDRQYQPLPNTAPLTRWKQGNGRWSKVRPHAMRLQVEAIASLALYGGLRRDEIYRLELEEMHPDNDVVVARTRKNREAEWEARSVPMFGPMRDAIAAWFDLRAQLKPTGDHPWLVLWEASPFTPGGAMSHKSFEGQLAKIGRGWEYHRMRHTCATELLRAEMPLEKVQKILGHRDIHDTLVYTLLLKGDILAAAARAEKRYVAALARTKETA